jgi:hypothetical protein
MMSFMSSVVSTVETLYARATSKYGAAGIIQQNGFKTSLFH